MSTFPDLGTAVRVSEIFTSIQGEGVSAGTPSVFVRLQGCSVGCSWCDTKYTWSPEGGTERSLDDLVDEVRSRAVRNVVVTGGEPLQNAAFGALVHALKSAGLRIEVETAGVVVPPDVPVDQWNVSIKLSNSGVPVERRLVADAIAAFRDRANAWFKFVVAGDADVGEVVGLQQRFGIPSDRVLLMPLGMTAAEQQSQMVQIVTLCLRHGFRFSPRLHTLIWGAKRGV